MKKSRLPAGRRLAVVSSAVFAALCVVLCASCAAHVSKAASGTIKLALSGFRGLETGWPDGQIPAFSKVVVTVSADDMDTVTKTFSAASGAITLELPAGSDRLVQVEALPSSGDGAPEFALAYTGLATVDLEEGKTTTAAITLALSKTKILLPDANIGSVRTADSLTGSPSTSYFYTYFNSLSDVELDDYGRLYCQASSGVGRYLDLSESYDAFYTAVGEYGLSYSPKDARLYYFFNNDYYLPRYVSVSGDTETGIEITYSDPAYFGSAIATDEDGYVYAVGYDTYDYDIASNPRIVKLSVPEATGGVTAVTSGLVDEAAFTDVGLDCASAGDGTGCLWVSDMIVRDGVLYVLGTNIIYVAGYSTSSIYSFHSRGKLVAIDTATMTKKWECGWSGDSDNFPTDPETQFYGPQRFIGIAPKKLYVADDGFTVTGTTNDHSEVNQNRVVEVDLDAKAFSGSGLQDASEFFVQYDFQFVC